MKLLTLFLIRFYQKYISFDTGVLKLLFPIGACKQIPTCSQYTYEAVSKYGTIRGLYLGFKRIINCR